MTAKTVKTFEDIRPGDRIQYVDPRGGVRTGRVVMRSPTICGWVVNTGGAHGTPGLVDVSNFKGFAKGSK